MSVSALMFPVPLIVALILVYRGNGSEEVRKLLGRIFDYKRIKQRKWYVAIIFLMPIIFLASYGVMLLLGQPLPEPYIPILTIPILFIIFFISAAGEEAGWMGYAVDPLQNRGSALQTSLILGLVWAVWHGIPWSYIHNLTWVAGQMIFTVAVRVLIVWLYNNTGKSVFAAVLFHDMVNVSNGLFPNNGSHYDPVITGTLTAITAVLVIFLWGRETLARYRYAYRHPISI